MKNFIIKISKMSTFSRLTKNPKTGIYEVATWNDDYFGKHHYGVEFSDGKIYDPRFFIFMNSQKMEQYVVIQAKNLESRKQQLLDHLLTGWEIVSSVYSGNEWVEYVLKKSNHSTPTP